MATAACKSKTPAKAKASMKPIGKVTGKITGKAPVVATTKKAAAKKQG